MTKLSGWLHIHIDTYTYFIEQFPNWAVQLKKYNYLSNVLECIKYVCKICTHKILFRDRSLFMAGVAQKRKGLGKLNFE